MRDFSPKDMAERILVRDLAVITWKKLRLGCIEHAVMLSVLNKPVTLISLTARELPISPSVSTRSGRPWPASGCASS